MLDYQTIDETIKATLVDKKDSGATPKVKQVVMMYLVVFSLCYRKH